MFLDLPVPVMCGCKSIQDPSALPVRDHFQILHLCGDALADSEGIDVWDRGVASRLW